MTRSRIYSKNKAFDQVYHDLIEGHPNISDGFEAAKKYHHAPEKLNAFKNYRCYFDWSNELYTSTIVIMKELRALYNDSVRSSSSWYSNKKQINNILKEFDLIKLDLEDLHSDIYEFQNCLLATDVNEKQAQINALSDQVSRLATFENSIIETCNRKLNEISTSRLTYSNLIIAIGALIVSLVTLYFSSCNNQLCTSSPAPFTLDLLLWWRLSCWARW